MTRRQSADDGSGENGPGTLQVETARSDAPEAMSDEAVGPASPLVAAGAAVEPIAQRDLAAPRHDRAAIGRLFETGEYPYKARVRNEDYERHKAELQIELLKAQEWIKTTGQKVVMLFEGRDAAGKGDTIRRFMEHLNPRAARVVALEKPSDKERSQWYFQRYINYLPAAGEIVMFDRCWYNRAGVERVMGFCTPNDYLEFMRQTPELERMLVRSGIMLFKYWFSVSDQEQERRFRSRIEDPTKRWKLSPMDVESRNRWQDYSRAKDDMLVHTDIDQARWYVVNSDNKKRAHLNCIAHLLSLLPYKDVTPKKIKLPERKAELRKGYERPPLDSQNFVPQIY